MPRRPLLRLAGLAVLALAGLAPAQDGGLGARADPALPFEIERPRDGIPIFVLGVNRFTPRQLSEFVTGVQGFLRRAEGVAAGSQLVWRTDGLRGYVALSTSPFPEGPRFLMTLRGQPVRTLEDTAAVLNTMARLGTRLLAEAPAWAPRPDLRTDGGGGGAAKSLQP